jgi:integrase
MAKRRGNSEGSIYQCKDSRWRGEISLGYKSNGRPRRKVLYGTTRAEVSEALKKLLRDQQQGYELKPTRMTVKAFLETWLHEVAIPNLKPATIQSYQWLIRDHIVPAIGAKILESLTARDVQSCINGIVAKGLSKRSAAHALATLRSALKMAYKWDLVPRNVAALVDAPPSKRYQAQILTSEQAKSLLYAIAGDRLSALYTVALALGLRLGEALAFGWEDVDLATRLLRVRRSLQRIRGKLEFVETKSESSNRMLRLPAVCVSSLAHHAELQSREREWAGSKWVESGLCFTSRFGTPLDGPNVTHQFQRLLQVSGLPRMRFHDLRHSAGSLLIAQGVHPRTIMEILGHSQIGITTDLYGHVLPELHDEAAEKMDALFSTPTKPPTKAVQKMVV